METLIKLNHELVEFHKFLHEKLGETAPALFQLREEIEKTRILVNKWLIERKGVDLKKQSEIKSEQQSEQKPKQGESVMSNENNATFSENALTVISSDTLKTRQDAYLLLEQAAEILMRCEPHSPVPYLARRLVAWKNKSLDDLMKELTQRGVDYYLLMKLFPDID